LSGYDTYETVWSATAEIGMSLRPERYLVARGQWWAGPAPAGALGLYWGGHGRRGLSHSLYGELGAMVVARDEPGGMALRAGSSESE
ncbi:MAG: hypothetical protein ACREMV_00730, partial [Gemmatimonadales bacterium]